MAVGTTLTLLCSALRPYGHPDMYHRSRRITALVKNRWRNPGYDTERFL